ARSVAIIPFSRSRLLLQRLAILLAGKLVLLAVIWLLIKQGGSFGEVLTHAGPNLAPVAIAGLGLTGIIFTGAIDLSIASIIAVAGTVFGVLVYHGVAPLPCWAACFLSAWALSLWTGWRGRRVR